MRILEICLVCFIVSAAVCLLNRHWRRTGRWLLAGSVVIAVVHGFVEGPHWQMVPAYAAVGVLFLIAWKPAERHRLFQRIVVSAALLLVAATLSFSYALPMFRLPKPTGSYPVGTAILYLKDTSRIEDAVPGGNSPRELMVQIWYPAEPSHNPLAHYRRLRETHGLSSYQSQIRTNSRLNAPVATSGAPFPVVLFNHGWGNRRTIATYLTEELASHGYVVVSIDHTYNAKLVEFPDGRVVHGIETSEINSPWTSTPEQVKAVWNKELMKWVADERFVLDQLEIMNRSADTSWHGRLNTNLVAAVGHSFGGAASTELCAQDPRVRGAVNLDGWFFQAIHARGANQPLLVINSALQPDTKPTLPLTADVVATLDRTDLADTRASLRQYGGYLVTVDGPEHDDFTDQPLVSPFRRFSYAGKLPAQRVQYIARSYILAFVDKVLRGKDSPLLQEHASPFPEASLEVWPEPKVETIATVPAKGRFAASAR